MRNNHLQYADQGVFHKEDFEESTLSAQIFFIGVTDNRTIIIFFQFL